MIRERYVCPVHQASMLQARTAYRGRRSAGAIADVSVHALPCVAAGGFLIGIAFGIGTRYVLRWMRHLGAGIEQQVALTFALGYLSFYTANGPAAVSGALGTKRRTKVPGTCRRNHGCVNLPIHRQRARRRLGCAWD